jgi:hypothetical protein
MKNSHKKKKSQEKKSQYIFSTFTIPRKVTVCIMSDFLSCDFFSVCHLCIVYIISHLLEEMYENQISVLLKFNVDILLQQIWLL